MYSENANIPGYCLRARNWNTTTYYLDTHFLMDPLSIAASAIALEQCAKAVRIGIEEVLSLRNASDDFLSLPNELSLLHAFLERSRRILAQGNTTFDNPRMVEL